MGIQGYQQNFPGPQTALVNQQGGVTNDGRFLWLALWNRTGQGTGLPSVAAGQAIVAGTPFNLNADITDFTAVPTGGVAQIPQLSVGAEFIVFNSDAVDAVAITPQPGVQIDGLAVGAAYSLAAGKMQWFHCVTPTLIRSTQLG